MLNQFKEFALRGNVVDLAIAVIIGAAFSKIVDSLVNDIFMPVIGLIAGGLDFSNYFIQLTGPEANTYAQAKQSGATIGYGQFITVAINFLIIALVLFFVVRAVNQLKRKEEAKPPQAAKVPRQEQLLEEIRDLLARRAEGGQLRDGR